MKYVVQTFTRLHSHVLLTFYRDTKLGLLVLNSYTLLYNSDDTKNLPVLQVRIIGNISRIWISWSADLNASRLLLLNLVLDPFIYVLTRKYYRDTLKKILCCNCSCCKGNIRQYLSVKKLVSSSGTEMSGSKASNPSLHKNKEDNCIQKDISVDVSSGNELLG